jgi:F0F1-type ATP synthase assembly protein I
METKEIKENKTTYKFSIIMAMSTSILLVTPVLILGGLGFFLDTFFHTAPWLVIIGGIVGFINGISNVFRMTKMMQERKAKS